MRRPLVSLLLCGAIAALASPNAKLDEAKRLIEDLELEQALKRLDAAEATPGNSRETLVEIVSLRGATLATLGKAKPAEEAFRVTLFLEPDFKLVGDYAPRVRTPFYAARDWAAKNGTLEASADVQQVPGAVEAIAVVVKADALKLANKVRFHVRAGATWKVDDVAVVSGRAKRPVSQPSVEWWAEVLSPKAAVLMTFGSEAAPRVDTAPGATKPVVVAETPPIPPKPSPPVVKEAEPAVTPVVEELTERAPPPPMGLKVLSFSLMGAGAVAAGVGVALGVSSNAARAQFLSAARDSNGLVTGLSRRDALALEEKSKTEATIANVLFVSGAALAATGVVLFVVDLQKTKVVMMPTPGGVALAGQF
ncbi:MAG: hypothetical protein Q8N26_12465 [Myxococcales bacterium]|nr:hypothetical protein [Myxococcales bacterium]